MSLQVPHMIPKPAQTLMASLAQVGEVLHRRADFNCDLQETLNEPQGMHAAYVLDQLAKLSFNSVSVDPSC